MFTCNDCGKEFYPVNRCTCITNAPKRASVPCARGRAFRAESFCESLGQCGPGAGILDTRRARSPDPHNVAHPGGALLARRAQSSLRR
jgi:hypothetical protein